MTTTNYYTAKGGQRCTTVAILDALRRTTPVVLVDMGGDIPAMLGIPTPEEYPVRVNDLVLLYDAPVVATETDVIIDWGTTTPWVPGENVLVTTPCYVALRRAVQSSVRPDAVVFAEIPGRALSPNDVEAALGAEITGTLPDSLAVARSIDAGLLLLLQRRNDVVFSS